MRITVSEPQVQQGFGIVQWIGEREHLLQKLIFSLFYQLLRSNQSEFQDPKMEVLHHIEARFWRYIPLHSPYKGHIYDGYLLFRFLKWPLI